ncbi:hypothetical protein OROGR_031952 [Orobanche gracilis]
MAFLDRPMMLKDFLRDDYDRLYPCTPSSSSSSVKPCKSTIPSKSNKPAPPASVVLLRSWSRKAAAKKTSAIHKLINVVRFLHFESLKSPPAVLTRSSPINLPSEGKNVIYGDVIAAEGRVKVKDILRSRSFRDVVEDESTPLDSPTSPNRTAATSACGKRAASSWCDGDFFGRNAALMRNTKGDWSTEECEQKSPVSVLDSPFQESTSPFHPSIANFERARRLLMTRRIQEPGDMIDTKSKQTIRRHIFTREADIAATEERAKQMLITHISQIQQQADHNDDHHRHRTMMLDFFMHELSINGNLHDVEFHNNGILRFARFWANGECDDKEFYHEWELEDKREGYVMDMEKGVDNWNKFKCGEQQEISIELEVELLDELIDQVLFDLFLTKS